MSSFFSKFFRKQKQKKSEPSLPRLKQNPGASASGPSLSKTMSRESSDLQVPSDDIVGVDHINTSELNSKKIENEFKLGQKYTRLEIARLLFPDRETFDEELLTRSIQISNYLIVFLELGIPGETGNEFPHRFDEKNNVITWFTEPNQFLSGSHIDKVLDYSIQQIFFIRYVASGPYCFWGEGKVVYFKKNVRTINGLSLKIGTVLNHRVDQKNSYSQQNMILQNLDGNAAFNALEIGSYYSRSEVAKIARPNNPPNGGDWITSYAEMDGNLYVFLNIGVPGKTGHDFDNRFDRASRELTWFSKPNKKSTSPLFQRILKGHLSLLFFIRTDTKNKFEFLGGGQVTKHMDNVRTKHGLALRLTVQLINSAPLERELDEQELPTEEVVDAQDLNYETELEDKYISQLINAYSTDDRLLSLANDSFLSTATFADFLADREMFEKEIKLVPKLGKKLSLELMQLLEQLRLSRLPEDQHEYTEDKNTENETTSTVSVRKFVEAIDCSYALYEQTRAPYFQQVYVEVVLENLDVFNSELTDRALLSQTVQHELLERLRAEKGRMIAALNREMMN